MRKYPLNLRKNKKDEFKNTELKIKMIYFYKRLPFSNDVE